MLSIDGKTPGLGVTQEVTTDHQDITDRLPSGGKFYPAGTRVYLRPFYYAEVRDMTSVHEKMGGVIDLYDQASHGVVVEGMDKKDLILGDFLFITFYRKVITLGADDMELVVNKNDIPYRGKLKMTEVEFAESSAPAFPVKVKLGSGRTEVAFYPVTIGQYITFVKENGKDPDELEELNISSRGTAKEIIEKIYSNKDVKNLEKVRTLIDFGIEPISATMTNLLTKEEESIMYYPDSLDTLVFPSESESEDTDGDEISFG